MGLYMDKKRYIFLALNVIYCKYYNLIKNLQKKLFFDDKILSHFYKKKSCFFFNVSIYFRFLLHFTDGRVNKNSPQ